MEITEILSTVYSSALGVESISEALNRLYARRAENDSERLRERIRDVADCLIEAEVNFDLWKSMLHAEDAQIREFVKEARNFSRSLGGEFPPRSAMRKIWERIMMRKTWERISG